MNQILVTKKLYVTPELKKKKKLYRFEFIISIFLVCVLFSYYIYAEYDKGKSEEVAQDILSNINTENKIQNDDTTIKNKDSILVVTLNDIDETKYSGKIEDNINTLGNEIHKSKSGDTYSTVAIVKIPKIGIEYPVLSKTTDELLKIAPNKFWGPDANEVGNYCIVGHNYRNKKFFSKVPTLENGDIIELTDLKRRTIKYMVYNKYIVDPSDVSCTSQHTNGKKEITLITCTNDSKQRYVIKATEVL